MYGTYDYIISTLMMCACYSCVSVIVVCTFLISDETLPSEGDREDLQTEGRPRVDQAASFSQGMRCQVNV